MKKILFLFPLIIILISCKKDNPIPIEEVIENKNKFPLLITLHNGLQVDKSQNLDFSSYDKIYFNTYDKYATDFPSEHIKWREDSAKVKTEDNYSTGYTINFKLDTTDKECKKQYITEFSFYLLDTMKITGDIGEGEGQYYEVKTIMQKKELNVKEYFLKFYPDTTGIYYYRLSVKNNYGKVINANIRLNVFDNIPPIPYVNIKWISNSNNSGNYPNSSYVFDVILDSCKDGDDYYGGKIVNTNILFEHLPSSGNLKNETKTFENCNLNEIINITQDEWRFGQNDTIAITTTVTDDNGAVTSEFLKIYALFPSEQTEEEKIRVLKRIITIK